MKKIFLSTWMLVLALFLLLSQGSTFLLGAEKMMGKGEAAKEKMETETTMKKESGMMKEQDIIKKESGTMEQKDTMKKETEMMEQKDTMQKEGGMIK
jgi:hypothetical protein